MNINEGDKAMTLKLHAFLATRNLLKPCKVNDFLQFRHIEYMLQTVICNRDVTYNIKKS